MFDNFSSITVACNHDDSRPAKRKQTLALTSEERQIDCVRTRYSGLADSVDVDAVRPPITQCFIVQPYRKLGSAFADPYGGWSLLPKMKRVSRILLPFDDIRLLVPADEQVTP